MQQHFRDNAVGADSLRLIKAAVAAEDGRVRFHVGDPSAWYGQAIDANQPHPVPPVSPLRQLRALFQRRGREDARAIIDVRAVALTSILDDLECVDLIDLDVQGSEAEVLEAAERALTEKVKRVHIGTHSAENEGRLRALFERLHWEKVNDYPCGAKVGTPWGPIHFQDGVQTWLSPAAGRASPARPT
jgi:FkbM family methyltransferase